VHESPLRCTLASKLAWPGGSKLPHSKRVYFSVPMSRCFVECGGLPPPEAGWACPPGRGAVHESPLRCTLASKLAWAGGSKLPHSMD